MNTQTGSAMLPQFAILVVFILLMYFILIRPQRKKDKEVADMRSNLQVGDEIVTIGGICGRIVKTNDETVVIEVGANKTKFEIKKWAVSTVEKKAYVKKAEQRAEQRSEAQEEKKVKPKRLSRKSQTEEAAEEMASTEEKIDAAAEQVENTFDAE